MTSKDNTEVEELTVEELMKIAKKKLKNPTKASRKTQEDKNHHIKEFIISENIKSHANILVPSLVIYDRYHNWCKNNFPDNIVSPRLFTQELKKTFKFKMVKNVTNFYINPTGFDLYSYEQLKLKYK